jgi:hypothetical protein
MVDCREDGIHVTPHKTKQSTGKKVIYNWSPELRAAVESARARAAAAHRTFLVLRPQRAVLPRRGDWPMSRVEVNVATVL